ncbi:MAG: DUF5050 domain-containing protein [Chitinophagaceae bacterium]|nr:DUF5050 domain-containing protein [Chitinophagaceae bacterium]
MKKIFLSSIVFCLFISCRKNKTDIVATSSNQSKIYFQGSNNTGAYGWEEIFSMNEDGSDQKQLTNFSKSGALAIFTGEPVLSPDGTKIFFNSHKDFLGGEIFSMNLDGSGVTKIIINSFAGSSIQSPFIYQNGQKIVYTHELDSFANRHGEIFAADINGNNEIAITAFPDNCFDPCVDPANTTIVYSNLVGSRMELYAMNLNGTNKHALTTTGPALKRHPQFSPDGTKIIFDAFIGVGADIFIINADGSNMTQLTNYTNSGAIDNYSWGATFSKDGKTIYFSSDEFNNRTSQLYKMNIDGSNKIKLTSSTEDKFNPCVK